MTERVETPEVSFTRSGAELLLRDEAGGGEVTVELESEASLTPASESWFDVPIDGAVSLEVESLRVRGNVHATIRDAGGKHRGNVTGREFSINTDGTYIDISATMKVLVYVERGTVTGSLDGNLADFWAAVLEFDEPTQVIIGARSFHEEPAATMTVPDEPEALMEAASYLGSSIKEWSAERSWSTLRGHPPGIEFGDELEIPDRLSTPDTDIEIAVPSEMASVLRVAPLAHYFGATVVPGSRAELRIPGHTEPLGSGQALEEAVDELLGRSLLLDSLVRIGGYYSHARYEYDELAPLLPFYPPELYDEPIARQLLEYLEPSSADLAPYVPDWPVTGTIRPDIRDAETVPYLLNSLARVHVTDCGRPRRADAPPTIDSPIELSTATNVPVGVSALSDTGQQRGTGYERQSPGDVSLEVVGEEPPARGGFDQVDWERFDVENPPTATYRTAVTREELRTVFSANPLYVHYGNRVTAEGFVCSDGVLAFEDLPAAEVGVVSFGWANSEMRPVADVLTATRVACLVEDPIGADAVRRFGTSLVLGHSVALSTRLAGFAECARFVGDASLSLARRSNGGPPGVVHAEKVGADQYELTGRVPLAYTDNPGRVIGIFPEESSETLRLAGNRVEWPSPASAETLSDIAAAGDQLYVDERPAEFPYETVLDTGESSPDQRENRTTLE